VAVVANTFYWKGGVLRRLGRSSRRLDPDLAAVVSLRTLQWDHCNDILQQTVADAGNDRASELSGDLAAGYYTVAIIDQDATEDPNFVFRFESPLSQIAGVPEPSARAMMLIGFAGLGYAGYRQRQKFAGFKTV
jgi:hypothetical protein